LNSGLRPCKAGILPLEPSFQSYIHLSAVRFAADIPSQFFVRLFRGSGLVCTHVGMFVSYEIESVHLFSLLSFNGHFSPEMLSAVSSASSGWLVGFNLFFS
jgi:hypothetical protein